jgi:hypothetical protein
MNVHMAFVGYALLIVCSLYLPLLSLSLSLSLPLPLNLPSPSILLYVTVCSIQLKIYADKVYDAANGKLVCDF